MQDDQTGLSIVLPARAEKVAIVRRLVARFGREQGMVEPGIGDLMTVVTEACMNVIAHAYDDGGGSGRGGGRLHIEALPGAGAVTVKVRDFGVGIRPRVDFERVGGHLGLALIAALTESFEIRDARGGGTELRMRVPIARRKLFPQLAGG